MRFRHCLVACLLAMPVWANGSWRVVLETPAEVVAIDLFNFQPSAGHIGFRERTTLRGGQPIPTACVPCVKFWRSG
ncbi:MAG: hypothetical protein QG662_747 [Pseudomonadota bacterium]|nr:hypothetical protein [Pseudomonadota bacterium]